MSFKLSQNEWKMKTYFKYRTLPGRGSLQQNSHRIDLRDKQCYREIKRTVRHDDERQRAATALKEVGEEASKSLVEKQECCAVAARRAV